jgi:hypothetical protein
MATKRTGQSTLLSVAVKTRPPRLSSQGTGEREMKRKDQQPVGGKQMEATSTVETMTVASVMLVD